MIGQRMESIAPSYKGGRCIFTEEQKDMIYGMSERMPICKIAEYAGATISVIRRVLIEKGYRHSRERTNKMISRGMSVSEKNQARKGNTKHGEWLREYNSQGRNWLNELKEKDPETYQKKIREMGETRRAIYEKERKRLKWGLPQKTRYRVKIKPVDRKVYDMRYRLKRSRNYYGDDDHVTWLYYDSQTKRSEELEQRAKELGLKIIQGEE